jgi:hypothetical protein
MSVNAAKQAQLSLASKPEGMSPIVDMTLSDNNARHAHQVITSLTPKRMDMPPKAKPNLTLGLAKLN